MSTIKNQAISGVFWSLLQNVGGKGITFLVTLLLARLLTPSAFGLIGMLAVVIQLSQVMVNAGFSQALIQRKEVSNEDYSSVFFLNLMISILLYTLLFFGATYIADFYHQPQLVDLTRVLTLIFVINAFSFVQEAKLTRELKFKKLMMINLPSTIAGGFISIILAYMGFGVWSIVALQISTRLLYALQIWVYAKWQPQLLMQWTRLKELFSFGGKIMLSSMIQAVYQNIYLIVLGRYFAVASVGYYQNANNLVQTPSATISGAISKVSFSVFSSIQDDNEGLRKGYKKIVQQLMFWLCPAFIFAAILAEPLFLFLFTAKWLPAVPYFQVLCVVGILFPLNAFNLNMVNVKGRSDLYLKLEIVKKLIITVGVIICIPFGIKALLYFQAFNSLLSYVINSFYSGRFISYGLFSQLKDISPIVLLTISTGFFIFLVNSFLTMDSNVMRLIIGLFTGYSTYWIAAYLTKLAPFLDFTNLIRNRLVKS